MYTYSFSAKEREALIDALKKGASRHESYARFYSGRSSVKKHDEIAILMRKLLFRLSA